MFLSLSDLISFYHFLGFVIHSDPFYPLPTRRIRKYKKLRQKIRRDIFSYYVDKDKSALFILDEASLSLYKEVE